MKKFLFQKVKSLCSECSLFGQLNRSNEVANTPGYSLLGSWKSDRLVFDSVGINTPYGLRNNCVCTACICPLWLWGGGHSNAVTLTCPPSASAVSAGEAARPAFLPWHWRIRLASQSPGRSREEQSPEQRLLW